MQGKSTLLPLTWFQNTNYSKQMYLYISLKLRNNEKKCVATSLKKNVNTKRTSFNDGGEIN